MTQAPTVGDYRDRVTFGLLYDVTGLLEARGIGWVNDDPRRRARALVALVALADAMAGPDKLQPVASAGPGVRSDS